MFDLLLDDRQPVRGDQGHFAAAECNMKITGRGRVNDPEHEPLAGLDVGVMQVALAIYQERVIPHIGKVHRPHAYERAIKAVFKRRPAMLQNTQPRLNTVLFQRIVIVFTFEISQYGNRVFIRPVRQEHDPFHIVFLRLCRVVKHQGAVDPSLLLQAGVRVIPVSAGMGNGVFKGQRLTGGNRWCRQVRHAVLGIRQEDAVPMNGSIHIHPVIESHPECIVQVGAYGRAGQLAVNHHGGNRFAGYIDFLVINIKLIGDQTSHTAERREQHDCRQQNNCHTFIHPARTPVTVCLADTVFHQGFDAQDRPSERSFNQHLRRL